MSTNTQAKIIAIFGGEETEYPEVFEEFLLGMKLLFEKTYPEGEMQIVEWNVDAIDPHGEVFVFPSKLAWKAVIEFRNTHESARVVVLTSTPEDLPPQSETGIHVVDKKLFGTNLEGFFQAILED